MLSRWRLLTMPLVMSAGLSGLGVSAGGDAATGESMGGGPPNIVFIMVDDMRDDDLRFMPATRRRLRDRGVRFSNALSPFPLCCPARASVLSGLYTHNHGVFSVQADYGFHAFDDRVTLATVLQDAGYATIYLGKYLNRYGIDPPPGKTRGDSVRYVPPGWTRWRASIDWSTYRFLDTVLSDDGRRLQSLEGEFQTEAYGRIAREVIELRSASQQPFFFYLSFTAPHSGGPPEPDDPPPTRAADGTVTRWATTARPRHVWGYWDRVVTQAPGSGWNDPDFGDKPFYLRRLSSLNRAERRALTEVTRQRAESLTVVDRQVGAVVRALRTAGELRRTVIVFTSDNGYFLGEQHMRQGKIYPHEPSARVPLLIRGPGVPAGATRRDPFTSIDFLPTLASAAGVGLDLPTDGVSLWNVARGGDHGWSRAILTETGALGWAPRRTDMAGGPLAPGEQPDFRFLLGIRTARYLYVDVANQRDELYDLWADPRQYENLITAPAYDDVKRLLRSELARMRMCRGTGCSAPLPAELLSSR